MAEFPRYQSKADPTTQMPSTQAPMDNSYKITEAAGEVGNTVSDIAMKWQAAVDTIQKTTSLSNYETGLQDIHNRAANDPNYNNSQQYFDEITKLKDKSLEGFTSERTRSEMALELGYKSKVAQIQVQNVYKKKMIDVGQASTMQLIKNEVDNPTDQSLPNIKSVVDAQVKAGLFHPDDAEKMIEKAETDLGVNRVENDLNRAQTPEQVDAIKQSVMSGDYEKGGVTISPKERESLLNIADQYRTKVRKQFDLHQSQSFNSNEGEIAGLIANGQDTPRALDDAKDGISDEFYKVAKDAQKQTTGTLDANKYIQLVTDFGKISQDSLDTTSKNKALMKFRIDILANKSKLDQENFSKLMSWTDPNFVAQVKPKANWLQSGVDYIKQHFGRFSDTSPAFVMAEFMSKALDPTTQPTQVKDIASQVVKENVYKNNPSLVGQTDVSNSTINQAEGIKQIYGGESTLKGERKVNQQKAFKPGDEAEKDGVIYVRQDDGSWRPKH